MPLSVAIEWRFCRRTPLQRVGMSRACHASAARARVAFFAARPEREHLPPGCEFLLRGSPGSVKHRDGSPVVLPLQRAATLEAGPRMRTTRKSSAKLPQPSAVCDARYPGREHVNAAALKDFLQKGSLCSVCSSAPRRACTTPVT